MKNPSPSHRSPTSELASSSAAAGILGAFSAAADWVWSRWLTDGAIVPGLVHGALIFVLLAVVLGRATSRAAAVAGTGRLLATLPAAGLLIAAAFYPLAMAFGYLGALLLTWGGMWLSLALLLRWALGAAEPLRAACLRALLAAIGSGLAFWAVSGMWTDPAFAGGTPIRFLYWTLAFLPGFLALLLRRGSGPEP